MVQNFLLSLNCLGRFRQQVPFDIGADLARGRRHQGKARAVFSIQQHEQPGFAWRDASRTWVNMKDLFIILNTVWLSTAKVVEPGPTVAT